MTATSTNLGATGLSSSAILDEVLLDLAATGGGQASGSATLRGRLVLGATGGGVASGSAGLRVRALMAATGGGSSSGSAGLTFKTVLGASGGGQGGGTAALTARRRMAAVGGGVASGSALLSDGTPARIDGLATELGVMGVSTSAQLLNAEITDREAGFGTVLGTLGVSASEIDYDAVAPIQGMIGSIQLGITPNSSAIIGHGYATGTDVSWDIRPLNAVTNAARRAPQVGAVALSITPVAALQFTKYGSQHSFQGNATVQFAVYGFTIPTLARSIVSDLVLQLTPAAALAYTIAPAKNHVLHGSVSWSVRAHGAMGIDRVGNGYGIEGTNRIDTTVQGSVSSERETTYSLSGRISIEIAPQSTITWAKGPPVGYFVQGDVTLFFTPSGDTQQQNGTIEQHSFSGQSSVVVFPAGRTQKQSPAALDTDGAQSFPTRKQRRRLIRVFR